MNVFFGGNCQLVRCDYIVARLRAVMIAWKKQYNFRPTNLIPLMPRDLLLLSPNTEISHQHFY